MVFEPTAEQCDCNERVFEDEKTTGYAIWYPQMGGSVGKAVVLLGKNRSDDTGPCFDVLLWHDGNFPLQGEEDGPPVRLHHCSAEQFILFGIVVQALTQR